MGEIENFRFSNAKCCSGKYPGATILSGYFGTIVLTETSLMFFQYPSTDKSSIDYSGTSGLREKLERYSEAITRAYDEVITSDNFRKEFFESSVGNIKITYDNIEEYGTKKRSYTIPFFQIKYNDHGESKYITVSSSELEQKFVGSGLISQFKIIKNSQDYFKDLEDAITKNRLAFKTNPRESAAIFNSKTSKNGPFEISFKIASVFLIIALMMICYLEITSPYKTGLYTYFLSICTIISAIISVSLMLISLSLKLFKKIIMRTSAITIILSIIVLIIFNFSYFKDFKSALNGEYKTINSGNISDIKYSGDKKIFKVNTIEFTISSKELIGYKNGDKVSIEYLENSKFILKIIKG